MPWHKAGIGRLDVSEEIQVEGSVGGSKLNNVFPGSDSVTASTLDGCWRGGLSIGSCSHFVALLLRQTAVCRKEAAYLKVCEGGNAALHCCGGPVRAVVGVKLWSVRAWPMVCKEREG